MSVTAEPNWLKFLWEVSGPDLVTFNYSEKIWHNFKKIVNHLNYTSDFVPSL